uniref:Secreted protein n=1 Tax=Ixodes scapularis TaxID=6945 RepID=A0A4D5RHH4_IXOSC
MISFSNDVVFFFVFFARVVWDMMASPTLPFPITFPCTLERRGLRERHTPRTWGAGDECAGTLECRVLIGVIGGWTWGWLPLFPLHPSNALKRRTPLSGFCIRMCRV